MTLVLYTLQHRHGLSDPRPSREVGTSLRAREQTRVNHRSTHDAH